MRTCGCPGHVRIVDETQHARFHALVVDQGGPIGLVNAATLRAMRGHTTETPMTPTVSDDRAIEKGQRVPGWLRRAAS